MSTLHLVFSSSGLARALPRTAPDDALVFLEDGVYVSDRATGEPAYCLGVDAEARGVLGRVSDAVSIIDYDRLVALCVEHTPIVSWR